MLGVIRVIRTRVITRVIRVTESRVIPRVIRVIKRPKTRVINPIIRVIRVVRVIRVIRAIRVIRVIKMKKKITSLGLLGLLVRVRVIRVIRLRVIRLFVCVLSHFVLFSLAARLRTARNDLQTLSHNLITLTLITLTIGNKRLWSKVNNPNEKNILITLITLKKS